MGLIYCKDCIHRPVIYDRDNNVRAPRDKDGWLDFTCPFVCTDSWYTRMPDDDFFCKNGEKIDKE